MAKRRLLTWTNLWERVKYDWNLDPSAQRTETPAEKEVIRVLDEFYAQQPSLAIISTVTDLIEALAKLKKERKETECQVS